MMYWLWQLFFVALVNTCILVRTERENNFMFLALYTVKLQSYGERKISEVCNSLLFMTELTFGTSCYFLYLVSRMVVFSA